MKNRKEKINRKLIIVQIVYLLLVACLLLFHLSAFADEEGEHIISVGLGMSFSIAALFLAALWVLRKRNVKKQIHPLIQGFLRLAAMVALAIYLNSMLEFVNNEKIAEIAPEYLLLDLAGILIIMILLFLILNSYKLMMLVMLVFYTVITMVFYAVYLFRGEPFQMIDVYSLGTAMEVVGQYKFVFSYQVVTVLVCSLCLLPLLLSMPDWKLSRRIWVKILMRVIVIPLAFGLHYYYMNYNWNGEMGIVTDLFAPLNTYQECGTQVGFFCVMKYMRVTEPDGYSVERTQEIAEESMQAQVANSNTTVEPVNIICVMNESFADYRQLGELRTNQEVMPFYDSLFENTIKGNTLVCIKGGGTAKSEYEFLTGNSVKRFPAMVPYVSYFTHEQYSLVTTLEAQGYESVVMHPYKKTNWNRPTAYRLLDFDEYISIDDFDEDAEKIRGLVSDRANYEKIIERVEAKENSDDKLFLFDITIQNHGGYKTSTYFGDINCLDYSDEEVDTYLSLIHESDQALEYLISYFAHIDEPTLVVFFGDHYPALPDGFSEYLSGGAYDELDLASQEKYYATPFLIWANYDIPEQANITTSTNYLGTLMLEQTGLEMAPYNYYLKNQMEDMPALNHLGYLDNYGSFHSWSDGEEDELQAENDYECLQYNNLVEDGKRLDWFFGLE